MKAKKITVRIPEDAGIHGPLVAIADREKRSLNSQILVMLAEWIERDYLKRPTEETR